MIAKDVAPAPRDLRNLLQDVVEVMGARLEIHRHAEHAVQPFPRHPLVRDERDHLITRAPIEVSNTEYRRRSAMSASTRRRNASSSDGSRRTSTG